MLKQEWKSDAERAELAKRIEFGCNLLPKLKQGTENRQRVLKLILADVRAMPL